MFNAGALILYIFICGGENMIFEANNTSLLIGFHTRVLKRYDAMVVI